MSYAQVGPSIYSVYQPDTPWQPGSSGWSRPYVPGWGENPNLLDTPTKAIQGLGCGGSCGCGQTEETDVAADSNWPIYVGAAGLGLLLLLALHISSTARG